MQDEVTLKIDLPNLVGATGFLHLFARTRLHSPSEDGTVESEGFFWSTWALTFKWTALAWCHCMLNGLIIYWLLLLDAGGICWIRRPTVWKCSTKLAAVHCQSTKLIDIIIYIDWAWNPSSSTELWNSIKDFTRMRPANGHRLPVSDRERAIIRLSRNRTTRNIFRLNYIFHSNEFKFER